MGNPTFYVNEDVLAARVLEYPPAAQWDNGVNRGGSNACGIGIGIAPNVAGTPEQFTLLDQKGAARAPQLSQPIGGTAYGAGSTQPADPLTDQIRVGTNSPTGDGTVVYTGKATLTTLAAGWVEVP